MAVSDKRGRKINEIISGVKIIKFTAWEKIMNRLTKSFRTEEGKWILKAFTLYNFSHSISSMIPTILGVVIFTLYDKIYDDKLSVAQIYELVTLFNATLSPIRYYIMAIMGQADSKAASERMSTLIQVEQQEPLEDSSELRKGEMEIKDGNFNWEDEKYHMIFENKKLDGKKKSNYILKDINVSIQPGDFVAIIGKVGAGKSSLLLSLMNEMVSHAGSRIRKNGTIAYISQEAFLQNDTIKNNITFSKKFNQKKFDRILDNCQIIPDLEILPGREETEIGERGVNMSGGQKQRINIARAVYSDSDIYLIDDALSALDAYVGKKIMDKVFCGEMDGKTRVMVTHHLSLLEGVVDKVILIQDGKIIQSGTFENVKKTQEYQDFARATEDTSEDGDKQKVDLEKIAQKAGSVGHEVLIDEVQVENKPIDGERMENPIDIAQPTGTKEQLIDVDASQGNPSLLIQDGMQNDKIVANVMEKETDEPVSLSAAGKMTSDEKRETGSIGAKYYFYYMRSAGMCLSLLCILFFGMSITMRMTVDWWVGQWQEGVYDENLTNDEYINIYITMGVIALVFLCLRAITLGYVTQLASVNIFKKIVWNILRRPMSFFDTTPSGVIINRCTNDVDQLDYNIPWMMSFFLNTGFNFAGALILTSVVSPIVIVFIFIALVIVSRSFTRYIKTTIELKRLVQLSAAPVISLSSELIEGVTIIRNYNKRKDLLVKYKERADKHHKAFFHDEQLSLWIRCRIEWCLALVVSCTIFTIVLSRKYP